MSYHTKSSYETSDETLEIMNDATISFASISRFTNFVPSAKGENNT
jgi:hypothetical protein